MTPVGAPSAQGADPSPLEIAVLARRVAKLAGQNGRSVVLDPGLSEAARRHAIEILADRSRATFDDVRNALRREGLADVDVLPFTAVGTDPAALARALEVFSTQGARPRAPTHVGVAQVPGQGAAALVAFFSARRVELPPLPARAPPRAFVVRGAVPAGAKLRAFVLGPCTGSLSCAHEVQEVAVAQQGSAFAVPVPLERGPGHHVFELLREGPGGPEVAAIWEVRVGPGATARPRRALPALDDPGRLAAQIARERAALDRAPLVRNVSLDRAALGHAQAVCASGRAAHVLPDGTDPAERARAAGYSDRVTENVAIGPTVARAHDNFWWSPSHRQNLVDPAAVHLGIGIASRPATAGVQTVVCVVELFGYSGR